MINYKTKIALELFLTRVVNGSGSDYIFTFNDKKGKEIITIPADAYTLLSAASEIIFQANKLIEKSDK